LTLIKRQQDIEDTVTLVKTGCTFYYGYSSDNRQPAKSLTYVASKLPWD
jgi:regulator of telomere elongation helicase 1